MTERAAGPPAGQTYRERPAPPRLREVLSCVWIQRVPAGAPAYRHRAIPNGCIELFADIGAGAVVVGPQNAAVVDTLLPGTTVVGDRGFDPAGGDRFPVGA